MRILIMGAGALGGFFGARLARSGREVAFVARGAHLRAMQDRGLRVESPTGDIFLPEVAAFEDPAEAGRADAVFFMVKNHDVEDAAARLLPALHDGSVVVTVQNGVSAPERLAGIIGERRVIPGMVYMPADIKAPGVIRHSADFSRLVLGPSLAGAADVADALADAVAAAGIEVSRVEDWRRALWEKFATLAPLAALTAMTRLDLGPIRECPETANLLRAAIDETVAVGRAECPTLEAEVAEKSWSFLQSAPAIMHASMLDDLRNGKRLELDYLSGEIVRRGRRHGIPTPVHAFADALLRPFAEGAPG